MDCKKKEEKKKTEVAKGEPRYCEGPLYTELHFFFKVLVENLFC